MSLTRIELQELAEIHTLLFAVGTMLSASGCDYIFFAEILTD